MAESDYINSPVAKLVTAVQDALWNLRECMVNDLGYPESIIPVLQARLAVGDVENFLRAEYKKGLLPHPEVKPRTPPPPINNRKKRRLRK